MPNQFHFHEEIFSKHKQLNSHVLFLSVFLGLYSVKVRNFMFLLGKFWFSKPLPTKEKHKQFIF